MLTQLDHLTMESVKLDTMPNLTIGQTARARSVQILLKDLDMKLQELAIQREAESAAKVRKTQEMSASPPMTSTAQTLDKPQAASAESQTVVKPVTPPVSKPLTVEQLMTSMFQSTAQPIKAGGAPESQVQPPQTHQPVSPPIAAKPALPGMPKPSLLMGKALKKSVPPPKAEPSERVSEERKEPSQEREKSPDSPKVRSKELRRSERSRKTEFLSKTKIRVQGT